MCNITVILSVYNSEKYLKNAIESIVQQTFTDFEFIIVNDGSKDNCGEIINEYAKQDKRIVAIHQDNIGLTKTLIKAINLSKGKYIARIDADDIAEPTRLQKQIEYLNANPEIDLVTSNYNLIDSEGKHILYRTLPSVKRIKEVQNKHNLIAHSTVMFRKSTYNIVGGYDAKYRYSQDWALWLKIPRIGIIYEPLLNWRIHNSNINFKKNNKNGDRYNNYFLQNIISMLIEQKQKQDAKKYIKEMNFCFKKVFFMILTYIPNFVIDLYSWKFRLVLRKDAISRLNEINNIH